MNPLVIYHGDCVDGFTAAWAARRALGEIEAVPARYGAPCPADVTDRETYVLDFAFPREEMIEMHRRAASLLVLDHHKTHESACSGLSFCTFDMERSGAGIAWDVLCAGQTRPWLVDYIEDRDLWRFALRRSREVNAFLRSQEMSFDRWDELDAQLTSAGAAELGVGALAHIDAYVRAAMNHARIRTLTGPLVPVVNVTYESASETVTALLEKKLYRSCPYAAYWFERGDGRYQYGLRSRDNSDVDVSEVARKFGGGGHKHAAEFVVDDRVDF